MNGESTVQPASVAQVRAFVVLDSKGRAVNRVAVYDDSGWTPPAGCTLAPDDGRPLYQPPAPTTLTASAFLARVTDAEQAAVAAASASDPVLLVGMVRLAAAVSVDLTDPNVAAFLARAVAAGALTPARAAVIAAP